MRFEKLRLTGFKSFVEPMEFVIERGLTGVVGPNGCGKSNLVEALRWVMGESSYKNMRASGMDDVIFSGSATRPARNSAEVTLFLDNRDRTAPAAFNGADELQVSRRIEREAGSAYRINGREARAKDVQLLFADQSTGARSPSMVGQGRIGELIQAKPQARRALLEEAAGISGLHSRRHEAELRLRAAEANLERLDDVTAELQTQIESLKRQARQASRFKTLSRDIREAEATVLHLRWTLARQQQVEAQSQLTQATTRVAERAQAQMEAAKAQAVASQRLPNLRDEEAKAAAALQRLTIARSQLEDEARRLEARQGELSRRIAQAAGDIRREEQLSADNAGTVKRLDAEAVELTAAESASREAEAKLSTELAQVAAELADAESRHGALTAERAELAARRNQLERALRDAEEQAQRFESQLATARRQLADVIDRLSRMPDPVALQDDVDRHVEELRRTEAKVSGAETEAEAARAAESATRPVVAEARAALSRVETEARTLAKVLASGIQGKYRPVSDRISVDRGYEAALGAALGEDIDLPSDGAAPSFWTGLPESEADPGLPDGADSLADHVKAPEEMTRRLRQIGVVADEDGPRLQSALKPGQVLVSRKGALWRWDGVIARADAPTAAAQRLAQKNRLAELEVEIDHARATLTTAEAALHKAEAGARAAVDAEKSARESVRAVQARLGRAREAVAQAERQSGETTRSRAVLEAQIARAEADAAERRTAADTARSSFAAAPALGEIDGRLAESAAALAAVRARHVALHAAVGGMAREREARARRIAAIGQEREGWLARAANAASQIAVLRDRHAEAEAELSALDERPNELAGQRVRLTAEIAAAEARRRAAADTLAAAETAQNAADKAATAALASLSESREDRGRAEERLNAAETRRAEAEARIREALQCEPHEAFRLTGLDAVAPLPDIGPVERRLEQLKIERERLGAVNLRAEEEAAELSDRYGTIVSERGDVVEAIRTLRQAIHSLNAEGRDRLMAAFSVVNGHFTTLFTHLFGGGTAQLELIESDDPLDAGLEIVARPPGKKPQTMTLLSGGEQALTAMALIFAVFLTNPAPICVLDEVDAPLDDHNVERFCDLMDEMARQTETRFVVITHNPITMARVDRLFGVTMAEQGVSQLVSVDLRAAERLREAV